MMDYEPLTIDNARNGTLLTLIRQALAAKGVIEVMIHESTYKALIATESEAEQVEAAMFSVFGSVPLATHRLDRDNSHYQRIDATLGPAADGGCVLRCNLAKMLCLPDEHAVQGLRDVHDLLVWLAEQQLKHPACKVIVKIMNHRKDDGYVYAETLFQAWARPSLEGDNKIDQKISNALNAELTARVMASPMLSHLAREIALSLEQVSPWGWLTLDERSLFSGDFFEGGPHNEYLRTLVRQNRANKEAAN